MWQNYFVKVLGNAKIYGILRVGTLDTFVPKGWGVSKFCKFTEVWKIRYHVGYF